MGSEKTILGIDTATPALVLGVGDSSGLQASHFSIIGRNHLELSIDLIKEILEKAEVDLKDISAITCGLGPGSLIGSRVGVVIAKTLAQVLKVPIIGISTVDIIAASDHYGGLKIVAVDALRDEVYWAIYDNGARIGEQKVSSVEDMTEELAGKKAVINGTAISKYGRFLNSISNLVVGKTLYPAPQALVSLGLDHLSNDKVSNLYDLEPLYLRSPV